MDNFKAEMNVEVAEGSDFVSKQQHQQLMDNYLRLQWELDGIMERIAEIESKIETNNEI